MTDLPPLDRLHHAPGDGWVVCGDHRHWGLFGAAGLLLVRRSPAGAAIDVVLQHRATWSDQGGTWALPGGARRPDESPAQGALREAREEAGIEEAAVAVRGSYVLRHPVWSYTTVIGDEVAPVEPVPSDAESLAVRWVPVGEVTGLPLHPAFADAWPTLRARIAARG